jgi:hypothetical protein
MLKVIATVGGAVTALLIPSCDPPTIGDGTVPNGLSCEEDEVIGYVPVGTPPYPIRCYHWEVVDGKAVVSVDGQEIDVDW